MWNRARRLLSVNTDAFTLVEILVAMAMVGMIIGGIYTVFISTNRSYHTQDRVADAQQRVRVGVDFMVRDIRLAGMDPVGPATDAVDTNGAGIKEATASKIRFTADMDMDGTIDEADRERITYEVDLVNNRLSQCLYEGTGSESWQALINDVSALSFSYRDVNDNPITVPVSALNLANIRTVVITMTAQGTDVRGETFTRTLNARISCRNLGVAGS